MLAHRLADTGHSPAKDSDSDLDDGLEAVDDMLTRLRVECDGSEDASAAEPRVRLRPPQHLLPRQDDPCNRQHDQRTGTACAHDTALAECQSGIIEQDWGSCQRAGA
eukprot:1252077-Rhodomonas_salina.2